MEQLQQIGEVLGSLNTLMLFRDELQINQRQCCLLSEAYNMAFEGIVNEIKHNLKFKEKNTKWNALENPLKELHSIIKEGKQYIKRCLEPKDCWWGRAISLSQNTDCINFHLHNLLWCISIVYEAIENASEISGCNHEVINKTRSLISKKYEREWMDPKLFQIRFGKNYLVSKEMCSRFDTCPKEDMWILTEAIANKRSSSTQSSTNSLSKHENQLAELLLAPKGKLFPISILVGSKDYQVKRRLGNGTHTKEIQWMGESFAARHFFGDIEQLVKDINFHSSIAHPNVMHYMYAFSSEDRKECHLVMELMNKDLSSYIKETCSTRRRRIPFPLLVAVDIMLQIARGMEYLHSQKIYHGDLNPLNILVRNRNNTPDGYLHVKVTGFGILPKGKISIKGPIVYPCIWYAPEVLMEQEQLVQQYSKSKFSEKADIYSFAMICFELLTGKVPFEDDHLQGEKMSRNIRAGERPLFPGPSLRSLVSLTKRCWHADPAQRPSFSCICRVLRYIKRFLIMHMDHNLIPELSRPFVDCFDVEMSLMNKFGSAHEAMKVAYIPFQMFAYRVVEREKTSLNQKEKIKEKSSESGSDAGSVDNDNGFNLLTQDECCPSSKPLPRSSSLQNLEPFIKSSPRKAGIKQLGQSQSGRTWRPPQLLSLRGRSLRVKSDNPLTSLAARNPRKQTSSGHVSDSELS